MSARTLVLASASPARLGLLRTAGIAPRVVVSGEEEDGVDHLDARETACTLARRKADAVAARLAGSGPADAAASDDGPLVLGCDSVLAFDGEVRGKPGSEAEAAAWWRGYRGRSGTLVTGHALVDLATGRRAAAPAETVVRFGRPSDAEIAAYVATGEPVAVAGGFTLDGFCAPFVDGIDGDHGTVLGLSLPLLRRLLAELGVDITALWESR
ncbi:MAG TPA: Maf family protein [Acidimicrobiales bacterium]|nr:Maf family protein [Acidimicrobiales bacterium]